MTLDVLTPSPLKLAVRAARAGADGQPPMFEVACRLTTPPDHAARHRGAMASFHAVSPGAAEWTLWKTFEDFQALDAAMRAPRTSTFARMMVPVAFAPEHKVRVFFHKDGSGSFLEKRRKELDYYMQRILMLPDVGDFCGAAGAGSSVLAEFLHASAHVACHANVAPPETAALSPSSTTSSVNSLARGLRQLHVDMRRAYSPPGSHAASGKRGNNDQDDDDELEPRSRKQCKHEIEEALLARGGESELRTFKKRASAFRKENDALCGARELVAFVNQRYGADRAFAAWLVVRFVRSLRSDEQRAALLEVSGLRDDDSATDSQSMHSDKLRRNSMDGNAAQPSTTRKRSKKEVLARVEKLAGGDAARVAAFKRAARALGNHQMATDDFVAFLNETFGDRDAQRILKLVVEVVPSRLQHELSDAVRP